MRWKMLGAVSLLMMLMWSGLAHAQSWFDLMRWRDPRDWPFLPLPEVATDPNGDTTVGFLPVWLFTDNQQQIRQMFAPDLTYNPTLGIGGTLRYFSYPSDDTQWYVVASGAETIERDIDFLYSTGRTRQDWWSFDARVRYERDPTERFFGTGNNSQEANETNFTAEQLFAEARLGVNLSRKLQIALELRPRYINIQEGAFRDLPFIRTFFPHLKNRYANYDVLTRLLVSYDTRDSISIPRRGSWLVAFGGLADRSLLSSVSYSVFGLEGRHYYPLGQRFTLASHAAFRYMPVGRSTPFWALSHLGGDRSDLGRRQPLRGFGDSRFVDNHLFVANVELRTRALSLDLFQTHVIFELAPFVEVGRVFHHLNTNPFSALHPVGGLGFRGIAEPFVVGYVDVGYGGEGVAVFSGIDYPF
ncbi:MAG: BamA/TamA family outer membrane protein [Candidatus Binatia bacterium]